MFTDKGGFPGDASFPDRAHSGAAGRGVGRHRSPGCGLAALARYFLLVAFAVPGPAIEGLFGHRKNRVAQKKPPATMPSMPNTQPDNFVDSRDFARIAKAIRFIDERFREQPRLEDVAAHAG